MNILRPLLFATIVFTLFSCEKEYSVENAENVGNDLIVGINCRINKIVSLDTANNMSGIGSIEASINSLDIVTTVTKFDSIANVIEYMTPSIIYSGDTVYFNPYEYFIGDINKRIQKMHGLLDPTDPLSLQFEVFYVYDLAGYLTTKTYFLTSDLFNPYYQVNYSYFNGNLSHMVATHLPGGELDTDADIDYHSNIIPKRYLYIFPDEKIYSYFTQFYNFGLKNYNAIRKLTVRNYDPGNIVRDSLVSTFSNYIMSRDAYVLSVQMNGDDQQIIPASAGKLNFSYSCK